MDIDREDLDLAELAREAGVTPRTIRYYVQQGLLPSPGKGPGTRYDRALVDRLQLIKLLQRQHLPLSAIRQRLDELDDDGVRRELGSPPELPLSDSALSYVRETLSRDRAGEEPSSRSSSPHRTGEEHDLFGVPVSPALSPLAALKPAAANVQTDAKWQVTKSTWERVRLSRNVELNIRRPLSREQNKQVDDLIEAARKIFSEER